MTAGASEKSDLDYGDYSEDGPRFSEVGGQSGGGRTEWERFLQDYSVSSCFGDNLWMMLSMRVRA